MDGTRALMTIANLVLAKAVVIRTALGVMVVLAIEGAATAQLRAIERSEGSANEAGEPKVEVLFPAPRLTTASLASPPLAEASSTVPTSLVGFPAQLDGSSTTSATDAAVSNSIATPQVVAWLTRMIHENLPPTYEDDRKWGKQKEVWDGVKVWREGWKLETKRRKKTVNAGTWTRYTIAFVEPEKYLKVQFHRLETLPDGSIAFHVTADAILDVFGRLSQWARDVQVISLSANADAAGRLTMEGTVQIQMNMLKMPPDIVIRPHIDAAHIELTHYRVTRISQVGGDFAKVLGEGLRNTIDDKIADLNAKLVEKLNQQLDKQSDKLRFSAQEWLQSKLPANGNASEQLR